MFEIAGILSVCLSVYVGLAIIKVNKLLTLIAGFAPSMFYILLVFMTADNTTGIYYLGGQENPHYCLLPRDTRLIQHAHHMIRIHSNTCVMAEDEIKDLVAATNSLQEQLRRAVEKLEEKKGKAKI